MCPMTFEEQERLIVLWRGRSVEAKARYHLASKQTLALANALGDGTLPAPDGNLALRNAVKEERAAMSEHLRLLKICIGIMRGETPDEEAWLKSHEP